MSQVLLRGSTEFENICTEAKTQFVKSDTEEGSVPESWGPMRTVGGYSNTTWKDTRTSVGPTGVDRWTAVNRCIHKYVTQQKCFFLTTHRRQGPH